MSKTKSAAEVARSIGQYLHMYHSNASVVGSGRFVHISYNDGIAPAQPISLIVAKGYLGYLQRGGGGTHEDYLKSIAIQQDESKVSK